MTESARTRQPDLFGRDDAFDALGEAFCVANDAASRRSEGITLTPQWLVNCMLESVSHGRFETIVDCGAGTGRFAIAAAMRFPEARIVAVEQNEVLAALLKQRAVEQRVEQRLEIIIGDFREVPVPLVGRVLFVGNPPYVRHHEIPTHWKAWYAHRMASRGIVASRLAGLHAHFILRACELMRPNDELCFVTSSEWMDNDYGRAIRRLLGGESSVLVRGLWLGDSAEPIFADALVSSVVVEARCGRTSNTTDMGVLSVRGLDTLREVDTSQLSVSDRWTPWCRHVLRGGSDGIELGELFRIHRGQVTGLNQAWVIDHGEFDLPAELSVPAVTRAKELIDGKVLTRRGFESLRRVVDLPLELDSVAECHRDAVDRFLKRARSMGADRSYIALHRNQWHSVGMRPPPAAFVTYMGRRPPVFCANPFGASFINVAHGLFPRQPVSATTLRSMLDYLNGAVDRHAGRTYGGGLAKFEPSDVARLRVPAKVLEQAT